MEEEWRDVKGYEGLYQVSNLGRVKSLERFVKREDGKINHIMERIMKSHLNVRSGRPEIRLKNDKGGKNIKLYRLVALAFVENDDVINKTCVNHKDGDVLNCKADNLEWCTYSENLQHSYDELNRPVNKPSVSKRSVVAINKKDGSQNTYESIQEANRMTGVSCTQIRRIAEGICVNEIYDFIVEGLNDKNIK